MRLGILEDEPTQVAIYELLLSPDRYECEFFGTIASFLDALRDKRFDLLVIDWILPDGTAGEALKWIRGNMDWHIPIICVTSRNSESDVVNVLHMGADDYFVKSSRHFELLARIETLARRSREKPPVMLQFGPYKIDSENQAICVDGKNAGLTQKEFVLACYLFQNMNKLLSRIHLLEKIWGLSAEIDTRTVDTHISRIRNKLNLATRSEWDILTIYGYGYRLQHAKTVEPVR
ncbi:MAG: response regulator transcription factor [Nitrosomonas sp.]|uniref:response regulator transcription factor n=1 Tax=Nitrosomonas sp. TaxID=42353 RepID=UPI0025FFE35E|nr:response regulator transcription factor [Nitrosomonas sp.]UJP03367.1 MAG: response regulator transcription factor [Nitrosomonas sp.]